MVSTQPRSLPAAVLSRLSLPLLLVVSTALYAAYADPIEEDLEFRFQMRMDDGEPVSRSVVLEPGAMQSVELAGGYVVELSAPDDDLTMGEARLLRREGEVLQPLHVLREPWRGSGWPVLGYQFCGERFSFLPLNDGEALPPCGSRQ